MQAHMVFTFNFYIAKNKNGMPSTWHAVFLLSP